MQALQDISLRSRLRRVITVTSVIVLTLVCLAICAYQFIAARYEAVYELGSLANVIEANSTAALATQDPSAAVEILNSLRTNPGVLSARIYRNDGSLFAEYERPGATVPTLRPEQLIDGHRFVGWQLIFSRRVRSSNRTLGTLVLRSDMHGQYTRLRDYLTIVAILMVASTGVAFLLAARLQNVISGPILELVRVARGIAEKKDCSLRVERRSK
ncbi:MAG TPA: CHASE sensor domain-containing protein, partial [Verrucomicrobiae bacterium]|nr:CHASE sensor domain-containing protein [Verrucomicrobiae bacterium]